MALTRTRTFLCAVLAGMVSGCLSPGGLDMDPVNVFQRRLADRGAQERSAEARLGLLQPVGRAGPQLAIHGEPNQPEVWLGLKDAILRAVAQNPDIRVVSFDPEVSRQQMIEAAAAFDVVAFGSYQQQRTNEQVRQPLTATDTESRILKAGVKELTPTGGTWSLTYSMTRMWDNSGFSSPPIAYEPKVALEVAQPLLRDAWPQFNLARLRIAQTNERMSQADFRTKVEQVVSDVITAYWALWAARAEVPIRQQLLQYARDSLKKVEARIPIDATAVEIKQAEAAVMQRQVLLEAAVKAVGDAQDALTKLLADPQLNLLSRIQVNPVSHPFNPVSRPRRGRVALSEQGELENALKYNPVLDKARLAIALADINITVARNQALPRLDLTGAASYQGLERRSEEAHETLADMHYLDYSLGLSMEYPLGNRERLAELRRRRIERLKAVSQLQSVADEIGVAVKERLREIDRACREIELDRKVVEATEAELQAIEELEKTRARTPEFLRLKLDTQSSLAEARIAELRAVRGYNLAISDLARVTGTILTQYQVDILLPAAMGDGAWPPFDERPAPAASSTQSAARKARSTAGTPTAAAQ